MYGYWIDGGTMSARILLIDDDERFTGLVMRALLKENYEVEIAEDGIAAWKPLKRIHRTWWCWIGYCRAWMVWKYAGDCAGWGCSPS